MNPLITNSETYQLQAFNLPSEDDTPDSPILSSPTVNVTRQNNEHPVVHVTPMGPIRLPKLYIVYGKYQTEMTLTADEQTTLQGHIDDLLKDPDIQKKLNGTEPESINLTHLCIEYVKDMRKKTIPLAHDLAPVIAMRKFSNLKSDPESEHKHFWPQRSPGMRTTIQREHGIHPAYARAPELQNLKLNATHEAHAFDHKLKGGGTLSNPQKLKALQRRHAATFLKDQWLSILQDEINEIDPTKQPERLKALEEAKAKLNGMWDFALQFEMSHPMFIGKGTTTPLLPFVQAKQKAALALIKKLHPKAENAEELSNDLARANIKNPESYRHVSKELNSPMKMDPLEDAFSEFVKKAADGRLDEIDETFKSWAIQDLLNPLGVDKARTEAAFKEAVKPLRDLYAKIDFTANPLRGATSLAQIKDFDHRIKYQDLIEKQDFDKSGINYAMEEIEKRPDGEVIRLDAEHRLQTVIDDYTFLKTQIKPDMTEADLDACLAQSKTLHEKLINIVALAHS